MTQIKASIPDFVFERLEKIQSDFVSLNGSAPDDEKMLGWVGEIVFQKYLEHRFPNEVRYIGNTYPDKGDSVVKECAWFDVKVICNNSHIVLVKEEQLLRTPRLFVPSLVDLPAKTVTYLGYLTTCDFLQKGEFFVKRTLPARGLPYEMSHDLVQLLDVIDTLKARPRSYDA